MQRSSKNYMGQLLKADIIGDTMQVTIKIRHGVVVEEFATRRFACRYGAVQIQGRVSLILREFASSLGVNTRALLTVRKAPERALPDATKRNETALPNATQWNARARNMVLVKCAKWNGHS